MIRQRWEKVLSKVFFDDGLVAEMDAMLNPEPNDNNVDPDGGGETNNDINAEGDDNETREDSEDTEVDSSEDEETEEGDNDNEDSADSDDSAVSEDVSELALLKQQNVDLLKSIVEMNKKTDVETPAEKPASVGLYETDEFKNLTEAFDWDKDEVSAFKLFQDKANERSLNHALQQMQRIAPGLVTNTINNQNDLNDIRTRFYDDNPALAGIKPYVAQVASQIAQTKGNKASISDVLEEAAVQVYKALKIDKDKFSKENNGNKAEKGKKPAFPKSKGSRKTAPKTTKLASDIDAMLAIDE